MTKLFYLIEPAINLNFMTIMILDHFTIDNLNLILGKFADLAWISLNCIHVLLSQGISK